MICINYPDTITIAFTQVDGYGTESIAESAEVSAAIDLNAGYTHSGNQTAVTSDAIVFIDPKAPIISQNFYRLEECLISIPLFNIPSEDSWYKVIDMDIGRDTQLTNSIDNIQLFLKKTTEVGYVS